MADYARKVKKMLSDNGCVFKRNGKGDHAIWYNPKTGRSFPVDHKIVSKDTANIIFKEAGLLLKL